MPAIYRVEDEPEIRETVDVPINCPSIEMVDNAENEYSAGFDDLIAQALRENAKKGGKARRESACWDQVSLKKLKESKPIKSLEKRTTSIFTYTVTENSALFETTDEDVDPLRWTGTMGWRWYTGFAMYICMMVIPAIIGFAAANILNIRDTQEHPYSWWKCGVFCGVFWSLILNCFTFTIIRTKVRSNSDYSDYHPSWGTMILCWLGVGVFMNVVWVGLYLVVGRLVWMHGTWAAFGGLIVGPILQCKFLTPKNYSNKEFKEALIICLATAVLFIPVQILFLCICLMLFTYFHQHSLALIPFYVVRITFDLLVEKVCFLGRASSLRIIFININALVNRLLLC